jgi:hypothetical protein
MKRLLAAKSNSLSFTFWAVVYAASLLKNNSIGFD